MTMGVTDAGGSGPGMAEIEPSCFLFLQGISDYINRCKQAIGKFESLVHQIHKNAEDITSRLTLIESVNLFRYPISKTEEGLPGMLGFQLLSHGVKERPHVHYCYAPDIQ